MLALAAPAGALATGSADPAPWLQSAQASPAAPLSIADLEPLREPVALELADGRTLRVTDLHRIGDKVRFQIGGQKRQVPAKDVVSPALERIPQELALADGRVLRVIGLHRADGLVRFREATTGARRQVAEGQVSSPALSAIPTLDTVAPPQVAAVTPPVTPPAPPPPPRPVIHAQVQFEPMPSRWDILDKLPPDRRIVRGRLIDPYNQNVLKGDKPIVGNSVFLVLQGTLDTLSEARGVPLPSGVSAAEPGNRESFGGEEQLFTSPKVFISAEVFQGQTAFRPKTWALKVTAVGNLDYLRLREGNAVGIQPGESRTRRRTDVSLEEAFGELKLKDLSPKFDVVSVRAGIQPFVSDFRGLVFNDSNLGARLFGNAATNRWQYNAAFFDLLKKEPNSELNTFKKREHRVLVANVFRQEFIRLGYATSLSYHFSHDQADEESPDDTQRHRIKTHYLGWAGDGHLGRINLSHALYYVRGTDEPQPIGRRSDAEQDVSAWFGALEASVDRDWARFKLTGVFASGDDDPEDGRASGFDSIYDRANFAGGPFSYWVRSGIPLTQTGVLLKSPGSLLPDLRSRVEGQANYVNPGLMLAGIGLDLDLTPKLRAVVNANYLRFQKTGALERLLLQPGVGARSIP